MVVRIISLLFIARICFSQSIIWEREYDLVSDPSSISLLPTIIDSEGNIATVIDPCLVPFTNAHFIKYDTNGNFLSYKKYFTGKMLLPLSLCETNEGYKFLSAINNSYSSKNKSLPFIYNISNNGDSLGIEYPYDVNNDEIYDSVSLNVNVTPNLNNNTISINNRFYNVIIKSKVKIDSNTFEERNHLIISCYDTNGKIVWRKGIDTLDKGDNYYFSDLKKSTGNILIILSMKYVNNNDYITQIIEVDTTGNKTKIFELPYIDKNFIPVGIDGAESNGYVVVGRYSKEDNTTGYLLTKINNNYEIIKKTYIPNKNLGINYESIFKTPKGNYLILGNTITDTSLGFFLYKYKILVSQYNSELDFLSDIEYLEYDHNSRSGLRHIHFIDESNFIAIGAKDIYKFYIAKFNDSSLTDVSESKNDYSDVSI
ncbi:MAG: hypothetical protein HZB41_03355 [Ignavibacteriae bacterium]|nr:hypothetical protein [Ignavibacteriota bacterium]